MQRSVGFEAHGIASVAQVEDRNSSRADRTSFQAILIEIKGAKMLAVAAVLPLDFNQRLALTFEIQLAQNVALIFTFDRSLPRTEESSFVLGTEYSHFRRSL